MSNICKDCGGIPLGLKLENAEVIENDKKITRQKAVGFELTPYSRNTPICFCYRDLDFEMKGSTK
jgi:hypothetical protein